MPQPSGDVWMTATAAATRLGVQPHTVYRLIAAGQLPVEHGPPTVWKRHGEVGERRFVHIRREELDRFIERSRVEPGTLRHLH